MCAHRHLLFRILLILLDVSECAVKIVDGLLQRVDGELFLLALLLFRFHLLARLVSFTLDLLHVCGQFGLLRADRGEFLGGELLCGASIFLRDFHTSSEVGCA